MSLDRNSDVFRARPGGPQMTRRNMLAALGVAGAAAASLPVLSACGSSSRGSESGTSSARALARRYFPSARPVIYRHDVENEARPFSYYLFSRRELIAELSAAGFALEALESDSILPERRLVLRPTLAPVDDLLCRLLPSWAGYGLRAICRARP